MISLNLRLQSMLLDQDTTIPNQFVTELEGICITLKREDIWDPLVGGNKFRKLKYNIAKAKADCADYLLTFGGAFSNHLVATAAVGKRCGIKTIGVVRGEELAEKKRNPTLTFCEAQGMHLLFVTRAAYAKKEKATEVIDFCKDKQVYFLPEGGTNALAINGCSEILQPQDKVYDTICTAVGTGGTFVGLSRGVWPHQQLLGWSTVKDPKVEAFIQHNISLDTSQWALCYDTQAGAYGKATDELIHFINAFQKNYQILLDPIYTGKLLFGIFTLIKTKQWKWGKHLLVLHTGGLQSIEGLNQKHQKNNRPCIVV